MLSEKELKTIVEHLVVELNATTMKDMGKVMGELNKRYTGCIDGKLASGLIKQSLSWNTLFKNNWILDIRSAAIYDEI